MKIKLGFIIGGLLLLSFLFYWFQYRPTKIRSHCDWRAKSVWGWDVAEYGQYEWPAYEFTYNSCLHEKGLK
ncbi:MAG: hypothetical protein UY16_C0003G0040 [Candidatus Gottesmanbacteria bacterium GW2011_GWA2_47_9]|uniref:Uncharacterized protein n=1 Tax=Candidatus Gottesmanbacteria bacterium GW2011_GWA2_47_9 TaxID=1618445 RepID=A0A0G1WEE8_9BACT|nr:MAG: hypothetical protein UY16_C0003G0040 [Candidatus Gottesmanbacteria bacterium GW2011_GWA2_47_9]